MLHSHRRLFSFLAVLTILSMFLTACPAPATPSAAPAEEAAGEEAAAEEAAPAEASWWTTAAEPYKGATIHGISESTPPSRFAQEVLAPQFTELTGINVEFEVTSWDEMYNKAIKDMEANTGIYDFVYIEQDIIYTYLARDFLTDLTQMLADDSALASPDFDVSKFTSFIDNFKAPETGDIYGVPMEAFIKVYLYRKDLFEDPAIQAAFKEKYGYDLAPATDHQQYRDIAEFFTQYGKDNGLELWGTTVQGNTGHSSSFYEYYETIAPTFGVYNWGVNMDTWKACEANGGQMNSQKAKDALAFWVGLLEFAPPEATSSTWDEVAASFAAGRAAQGWVYGENAAWIATDPERSTVVGKVGVALPPVAEGVMADAESGAGYIGYYDGGAFGIPHSSKNKEAALLWLQYIGQESVQADWAVAGSRIVMESTYDDPKVQEVDAKVDGYYTLMREQGPLFRGAPPFPFHPQLRSAVEPFIWRTLAGELEPGDALDQACVAAEETMQQLGYGQ
ncbi:MAG: sugar ABC transporter substrate-binding protein [Chloroflexi bacterium]|nr:MAG: sugar ABC transporter substrate-binding protein [Chloroflexota bacterium]